MPSTTTSLPFELNEDLWFDDGDVNICARRFDSGVLCLYKLYRDVLAVHSSALLRSLDKSLVHRRIYFGNKPYAYLADDDALDLELFLVAICYPTYCFFWKLNARSFRRALPVFRIALKYGARSVIEDLAAQLEQDWPKTISEWDASQGEDGSCSEPSGDGDPRRPSSNRVATAELASAVQVARIANVPGMLSVAYYQLSRVGKLDGRILLSKEDGRCLASGKANLTRYMHGFKKRLLRELALHPSCADAWNASVPMESEDVLSDLLEVCSVSSERNMCPDCRERVNERGREERGRVWELLPQLFCPLARPVSGTS